MITFTMIWANLQQLDLKQKVKGLHKKAYIILFSSSSCSYHGHVPVPSGLDKPLTVLSLSICICMPYAHAFIVSRPPLIDTHFPSNNYGKCCRLNLYFDGTQVYTVSQCTLLHRLQWHICSCLHQLTCKALQIYFHASQTIHANGKSCTM